MTMPSKKTEFDSDGFDLGATASDDGDGGGEGVIYEIGGGVTTTSESSPKKAKESHADDAPPGPMDESERLKGLGNEQFKQGNHLDACDYYTEAIEACPHGEGIGPTGKELLRMRDKFDEQNRERMMERHRMDMEKRRKRNSSSKDEKDDEGGGDEEDENNDKPVETFSPPRHLYGPKLAVYHANRAASLLHLGRYGEVIEDCDISLLLNPTYVKAYLRRSTAHERVEDTESALKDAQKALQLEPTNAAARKNVARLKKIEEERLEKLKDETMGKLKDLGNSLLSNFGMSLDNFNAVQDPKTGGYSISFNQNANKK